jgi:hypothetical protein
VAGIDCVSEGLKIKAFACANNEFMGSKQAQLVSDESFVLNQVF